MRVLGLDPSAKSSIVSLNSYELRLLRKALRAAPEIKDIELMSEEEFSGLKVGDKVQEGLGLEHWVLSVEEGKVVIARRYDEDTNSSIRYTGYYWSSQSSAPRISYSFFCAENKSLIKKRNRIRLLPHQRHHIQGRQDWLERDELLKKIEGNKLYR